MTLSARDGARHVVHHCGGLRPGERVIVIGSEDTIEVTQLLAAEARTVTNFVEQYVIPVARMHGAEPPAHVAEAMVAGDLVIGVTSKSMAHTGARLRACQNGARYLSLPEYSLDLLSSDDLDVDYLTLGASVRRVTDALTAGNEVVVTTQKGTHLTTRIVGRIGNCCPGYVRDPGSLGSPPDIEANVSPLETESNGRIVVDGSIAHPTIGVLSEPVTLFVEGGRIRRWEGPAHTLTRIERLFDGHPDNARVLAECGIGMNPRAVLRGLMLTDEGCAGAVHFGFGSNSTVGGLNSVDFHLDFCVRDASLAIDGRPVLYRGVFAEWTGFTAVAHASSQPPAPGIA